MNNIPKQFYTNLKNFISKDITRPFFINVYCDAENEKLVATDGKKLIAIKVNPQNLTTGQYELIKISTTDYRLLKIENPPYNYPDYTKVIPEKDDYTIQLQYTKSTKEYANLYNDFITPVINKLLKYNIDLDKEDYEKQIIFQGLNENYFKVIPDDTYTVNIYTSKNKLNRYYFFNESTEVIIVAMNIDKDLNDITIK